MFRRFAAALVIVTAAAVVATAQTPQIPRTKDGKPNFTGIWQVMNTANWDIQTHAAKIGPVIALGAAFSIPPGVGVVEGEEIPYQPAALNQEAGQPGELADPRPGDQVLHARDSARHLHAVSVSDRAVDEQRPDGLRVRQRQPRHPDEQQREESGAGVDGVVASAGGRATRSSSTSPITWKKPGSIAPAISTATR